MRCGDVRIGGEDGPADGPGGRRPSRPSVGDAGDLAKRGLDGPVTMAGSWTRGACGSAFVFIAISGWGPSLTWLWCDCDEEGAAESTSAEEAGSMEAANARSRKLSLVDSVTGVGNGGVGEGAIRCWRAAQACCTAAGVY